MSGEQFGLSRREMERELAWMLRRTPSDPAALAKVLGDAFIALIEKNNAAIAAKLAERDDVDEEY